VNLKIEFKNTGVGLSFSSDMRTTNHQTKSKTADSNIKTKEVST